MKSYIPFLISLVLFATIAYAAPHLQFDDSSEILEKRLLNIAASVSALNEEQKSIKKTNIKNAVAPATAPRH